MAASSALVALALGTYFVAGYIGLVLPANYATWY
jgi:hypothetical protein